MKRFFSLALAVSLSAALPAVSALAQQKEHPKEHPQNPPSEKKLSTDDIDAAIRAHIDEKSKASGGRFEVRDDVMNKSS